MDIKIVNQNNEEVTPQIKEPADPATLQQDGVMMVQQVAELFDYKPSEISQQKGKINTLIEYAKTKTDDHSPQGIKWAIRQLGIKLGTPPMTERLIDYLHRYAYLYLEGKKIEAQKEKFLRGERDE